LAGASKPHSGLGIVYVPHDKLRRSFSSISQAEAGTLSLRDYHSLLGLLQSLIFVVGLRRSSTFGLWEPLAGAADFHPERLLAPSPAICERLAGWRARLAECAGASFEAGVEHSSEEHAPLPRDARLVFVFRSDASKDGARLPGLGGCLGGKGWRYPDATNLEAVVTSTTPGSHNISMDGRPLAHPSLFFPPGYDVVEAPLSPSAVRAPRTTSFTPLDYSLPSYELSPVGPPTPSRKRAECCSLSYPAGYNRSPWFVSGCTRSANACHASAKGSVSGTPRRVFRRCSSTARELARATAKREGGGEGVEDEFPRETPASIAGRFALGPEEGEGERLRAAGLRRRSSRAPDRRRVDADMRASRTGRGMVAL
jgi:hypothetical protein